MHDHSWQVCLDKERGGYILAPKTQTQTPLFSQFSITLTLWLLWLLWFQLGFGQVWFRSLRFQLLLLGAEFELCCCIYILSSGVHILISRVCRLDSNGQV